MTDLEAKRITLDAIYVRSKMAQQSVHYGGLWEELLKDNLLKMQKEVSNEKLDPERR